MLTAIYVREGINLIRRHLKAYRARPMRLVVRRHVQINDHLCKITLARADNRRLPAFAPGQYITIHVKLADGNRMVRRRYSLAAFSQRPRAYELCIKREEGGVVSDYLFSGTAVGDYINAGRPVGRFRLDSPSHAPVVLIAGGVGITPLRAMIHARYQHPDAGPTVLFHAAKHKGDLVFYDDFVDLMKTRETFTYHPVLTKPQKSWTGMSGRLCGKTILAALSCAEVSEADFYICASASMTGSLKAQLVQAGMDEERIYMEPFGLMGSTVNGVKPIVNIAGERNFTYDGYSTLLQALDAQKIPIDTECRTGDCGRCRLKLLSGKVEWLLNPETQQPPDTILACCCAPVSDVTIASIVL